MNTTTAPTTPIQVQGEKKKPAVTQKPTGMREMTRREAALEEASAHITGGRDQEYGDPQDNFERIMDIWNVQLGPQLTEPLSTKQVAQLLIGLKLARLVHNPNHHDSAIDIIGYAALSTEVR